MTRHLAFLCLIFVFFLQTSQAEETYFDTNVENSAVINLSGAPNGVVHGCVNVISGDFLDHECDFVSGGNDPIRFERSYASSDHRMGHLYYGWFHNHGGLLHISGDRSYKDSRLTLEGHPLSFYSSSGNFNVHAPLKNQISLGQFSNGYTNCSAGIISGKLDKRNLKLEYTKGYKNGIVKGPAGEQFIFDPSEKFDYLFQLKKLVNANGNIYHYCYQFNCAKSIMLYDSNDQFLTAISIDVPPDFKDMKKDPRLKLHSSDGREVVYHFTLIDGNRYQSLEKYRFILTKVERPNAPSITYDYSESTKDSLERIERKIYPENRFTNVNYYSKKGVYLKGTSKFDISSRKHHCFNKVYQLSEPVGHDSRPIPIYTFLYQDEEEHKKKPYKFPRTIVYDAYNRKTEYEYLDKSHRLQKIEKFDEQDVSYTKEYFYWDGPSLYSRNLCGKEGNVIFTRKYVYDDNYNVKAEIVYGNLKGTDFTAATIDKDGNFSLAGCVGYEKRYEYSKDGRNNLTMEFDLKFVKEYCYYEMRGLLTNKYLIVDGKKKKREFFKYDPTGSTILEVVDNGSSFFQEKLHDVTVQLIKRSENRNSYPVGMPETVRELYLDPATKTEKLLIKKVSGYDNWGRLINQKVYDCHEEFAYELTWAYDNFGNVIRETDPIGQVTERRFDANSNKIYEQGPNFEYHTEFVYDYSNRLIRQEQIRQDGTRLVETFSYDYLSNKIASTDIYGNQTRYEYDAFKRLIKTILPAVPDEAGKLYNPTITMAYDEFNNVIEVCDANGQMHKALYTLHGKPYYKEYPDGSYEKFEYDFNGELLKEIAKDGSYTIYTNDYLSRPLKISKYNPQGVLLSEVTKTYDVFNILTEIDPSGLKTEYSYDGAGRLIAQITGDHKESYFYDSLGRRVEERTYFGEKEFDYISKKTKYDLLNRPIEDSHENAEGSVQKCVKYGYNADGNKTVVTMFNENGPSTIQLKYDSRKNLIHIEDALGNVTTTVYNYSYYDKYGCNVPYNETIDASGNITVTISDALEREVCTFQKNPLEAVVKKSETFYDAAGNKILTKDYVIVDEIIISEIHTRREYDAFKNMTTLIEAEGTPEQRSSRFDYDNLQRVVRYIKPDGTSLIYEYDDLGRLRDHYASDNSFHYNYEYDKLDHPIKIDDLIQNTTTLRTYDHNGKLKSEMLANGLSVDYSLDAMGRTIGLDYPDGTSVTYAYQGAWVSEVNRYNDKHESVFSHKYLSYDQTGNCLDAKLVGNAGTLKNEYDILNRIVQISAPEWKEEVLEYDAVGNLLAIRLTDAVGSDEVTYEYDDLSQLIREDGYFEHSYVNDSLSNHVEKDGAQQSFNHLNQLLDDAEGTFVYDMNGNLIRRVKNDQIVEYKYDALNRLVEVSNAGQVYKYVYDSFNRRIAKTDAQTTKRYLYAGVDEVGVVDESNRINQLRILGIGKGSEVGAAIAIELDTRLYAPVHDHNGHVRGIIDAQTGKTAETYRFSAFGEEKIYDEAGRLTDSSMNPWRFASKRADPETGLIYFGERYYDPSTCRWISNDPLGFEGGPNLYAYVNNRPLNLFDSYGLFGLSTQPNWMDRDFSYSDTAYSKVFVNNEWMVNNTFCYPQRPVWGSVGDVKSPDFSISYLSGMSNKPKDTMESAQYMSKNSGGIQIDALCTPTGGYFGDPIRYTTTRTFDVDSLTAKELRSHLTEYLTSTPADVLALVIGHSEGCEHILQALMRMPKELRDRVVVRAFAPSVYIPDELCHSVVHYCSKRDPVPLADVMHRHKHLDNIRMIDPAPGADLFDHSIMSPTFKPHLQREIDEYLSGTIIPKHYKINP